jgi:hypothetical protein
MIEVKEKKLNLNIHTCSSIDTNEQNCFFCKDCDIMMDINGGKKFYRPRNFSKNTKLIQGDGNKVIKLLLEGQKKNRFFNNNPTHKSNRAEMIKYLKNLNQIYRFKNETFHLGVSYADSVFSMVLVKDELIVLFLVVCLFMAAKMNENNRLPRIDDLLKYLKNHYSHLQFMRCEQEIFKLLDFSLNIKTPFVFLSYFIYRGIVSQEDLMIENVSSDLIDEQLIFIEDLAFKLLDFTIETYYFYQYISVAVAASVIATVRKIFACKTIWNEDLANLTSLSWENIQNCTLHLYSNFVEIHKNLIDVIILQKNELKLKIKKDLEPYTNLTPIKNHKKNDFLIPTTLTKKENCIQTNFSFSEEDTTPIKKNFFSNKDTNKQELLKNEEFMIEYDDEFSFEINKKENISLNEKKKEKKILKRNTNFKLQKITKKKNYKNFSCKKPFN